jgi:multidrug transporter EmrE-like cation transporter
MTVIGVSYFGENVSLQQYVGMGIVIAGLAVMMIQ